MIGIFIGIAAVVSLIGLGEGLRSSITGQLGFIGTDMLSITASGGFGPPGYGVVDPLTKDLFDKVRKVRGVKGAAARIIQYVSIEVKDDLIFGASISMPSGEQRKFVEEQIGYEAEKGRLLEDGDKYSVVLGASIAKTGNLEKEFQVGKKILIDGNSFTIVGILNQVGNFVLDGSILINEEILRDLYEKNKEEIDLMAVQVENEKEVAETKERIEKLLRKERNVDIGEENFEVSSPASALEQVNSIITGVNLFVIIIASISLVVGGIGITNTMYTAVVERTREIGIMKAIGATNNTIFALFAIESGLMGAVGGIIGALLGWGMAEGLAAAGRQALGGDLIGASVSAQVFFGAILFSFLLGTIFGSVPAYQASKLHPVDALRKRK